MTRNQERLAWATLAVAACVATALLRAPAPQSAAAQEHANHHAPRPIRDSAQTAVACRQGAFVQAASLLGSIVEVERALPGEVPVRAREELDGMLWVAVQQAAQEVHCVTGALEYGYELSFAQTLRHAAAMARERGQASDVERTALEVAAALEANKRVEPTEVAAAPHHH